MGRSTQRGRPELVFDFYNDDWDDTEDSEGAGLLGGWGNDELDRLLAGSGAARDEQQPGRKRAMSYGTKGLKRKAVTLPGKGGETDPTVVPNSSMFGFLERLPWNVGKRGVKYKPSAADLQEHPGRKARDEGDALLEESEGEEAVQRHRRKRSGTTSSRSTNNSLSSRGDLFPSEDEDDAVPLDDEFAMVLERRSTNTGADEASSGKTRGKRPSIAQSSTKTGTSKDVSSAGSKGRGSSMTGSNSEMAEAPEIILPSIDDLKLEEERVRQEDEAEVERKREAAHQLALERGLPSGDSQTTDLVPAGDPPQQPDESSRSYPASPLPETSTVGDGTQLDPAPDPNHQQVPLISRSPVDLSRGEESGKDE